MSEPIVFISHHRVKEGMLDEFRQSYRAASKRMEANKPGTVAFLHYFDEDSREVTSIHVVPYAEAMEQHMEGVNERVGEAAQYLEFGRFEIYGTPSEKVMEIMRQAAAGSEGPLAVVPEYVAGYLRLKSG